MLTDRHHDVYHVFFFYVAYDSRLQPDFAAHLCFPVCLIQMNYDLNVPVLTFHLIQLLHSNPSIIIYIYYSIHYFTYQFINQCTYKCLRCGIRWFVTRLVFHGTKIRVLLIILLVYIRIVFVGITGDCSLP